MDTESEYRMHVLAPFYRSLCATHIRLHDSVIAVYTADVSSLYDATIFSAGYCLASPYRKNKIDAFIFEKDKVLSLGVELLLRHAMYVAHLDPESSVIELGEHGKPRIENQPSFHYNLSHAGTKVMCVASDRPVGSDVEQIQPVSMDLAKHCFFKTEITALRSKPVGVERDTFFYRLWTVKEAFMKATGLGMALPLDAFEIRLTNGEISGVTQTVSPYPCHVSELRKNDGYCYAVCSIDVK